jgi:DNA replication initiation complex subunit (GINS family)
MYDELCNAWKRELENVELGKLPDDFYVRIADYLKRLKEENRMLDKRTVKASLLEAETKNVRRLLRELVRMRYRKLVKNAAVGQKAPADVLTKEEAIIYGGVLSLAEAYQKFAKGLLRGHVPKVEVEKTHKRMVLRFFREIPAIIGFDMKTYGPFMVEDVASLPVENARILVKQGLAEVVEAASG